MKDDKNYGIRAEFLNIFGDFDRLDFPGDVHWIAGGCGGNGILIKGRDKAAVIDCGMAYCGQETVDNIKKYTDRLDYIICSHSHYDHIGGIPYLLDEFPGAVICGSEKCSRIFSRENALEFMKVMGENARDLYSGSSEDIRTDGLHIDFKIGDGDVIDLGCEKITVLETRGHTDCSLSFLLEPESILFASESTGIIEGNDYVHTPILKSMNDAFESLRICRNSGARHVFLPHFGLIPPSFNESYFQMFEDACIEKIEYVRSILNSGISEKEMLYRFIDRYRMPSGEKLQPFKAYAENARHLFAVIIKYIENDKGDKLCLTPKK